ncbi:MAG: cysteine desulfurase NifS [Ruminococcaceae bacterium]|nr:cysteine desulfurase NifS [Oscillospiraceae bacterium]
MERSIYLDNSATTPLKKEVLDVMMPCLTSNFGNASSIYKTGRKAKTVLEAAREKVAKAIGAEPNEIYFTGSGSEADNWAIKGIAEAYAEKGKHIISTKIEHHAVLHTLEYLQKHGYNVTYLPVDSEGLISLNDLKNAIQEDTILITVMTANNEIGTIQPIEEIGRIAKEKKIIFHTDAVQAVGMMEIDVKAQNIDMLSLSAHKFGGPKGVGALYVRKGIKLPSYIHGGGQERNKRAGTENIASIVGLGAAIEIATDNLEEKTSKIRALRDKLISGIEENIPYVKLNGHREKRLAGNVNFSFEFIEGEALLLMLDLNGIEASSGSACTSGSLDPSHVLLAIGLPHEIAHGSLRLSVGDINTEEDVDYVLEKLPQIVQRLREMSPLYERVNK